MIFSYDKKINRKVRVFISSTFSDMEQERNTIVYNVFPRLRQEFSSQMIDISEVDLRWGIPEEDSENSKILEICIGEVLHCYPFFVGIVGQRYGTIASTDAIDNLPPAYRNAIGKDFSEEISITELEMRAGAFVPNNVDFSCFFIKSNIEKLELPPQLKRLIENIHRSYIAYTYDSLETFGNQMFNSLRECILKVIPEKLSIPYADKYYYSHLNILKNNAIHYIPNNLLVTRIERQITAQRRLYIRGEKGIGKSACISWLAKCEGVNRNENVFFHFAAVGNDSLNIDNAFFRLRLFLQSLTDYESSETDNRAIVTELLGVLPSNIKVTLYFDAMDHFNDITAIYQFFALADINQNVFVVCSGIDDYARIPLEQTILVEKLTSDQIRQILKDKLIQFGKKLSKKMYLQIIEKESCSNPLFLQAFITQLRMYGTYDTFENFFNTLIKANTFEEVFSIVIQRLKHYFIESGMPDSMLDEALAMIVYSKNGIKESELQEILALKPITRSVFLSTIELFTIEKNGLLCFSHDLIIQTTKEILAKTHIDYEKKVAKVYVNFFSKQPQDWRRYSEETFQLCKLNRIESLAKNLSNKDCFMYLRRNEYHSIIGYLSNLIEKQLWLINILMPQLDDGEQIPVADIFCQAGCYHAAITIVESQLVKEGDPHKRIQLMDVLARSQYKLGLMSFKKSLDTYGKLLSYYKEIYPQDEIGYATRAYLMGVAYKTSGKLDKASLMLADCVAIYEKHHISTATSAWILDVYSESCYASGNLKKALNSIDKAIATCTSLFGKSSTELAWAYCYGWNVLYALGEKINAMQMIWDAYKIYNQIYFGRGTKVAWVSLNAGTAAMIAGNFERAEELYNFSIKENDIILPKKARPHTYSITVYANLSNLFENIGRHECAVKAINFALDESIKKNGKQHIYTANILLNVGILEHNPMKIQRAIDLYEIQQFKTPDTYFARVCLARILSLTGSAEKAATEIEICARKYFSVEMETELISYLIIETLDKVCGNLSTDMIDKFESLCRFDDYKFYLTYNNNSNVILIPSI